MSEFVKLLGEAALSVVYGAGVYAVVRGCVMDWPYLVAAGAMAVYAATHAK